MEFRGYSFGQQVGDVERYECETNVLYSGEVYGVD